MKKFIITINGKPIHYKDGTIRIYEAGTKEEEKELRLIVSDYNHPRIVSEGVVAELKEVK